LITALLFLQMEIEPVPPPPLGRFSDRRDLAFLVW